MLNSSGMEPVAVKKNHQRKPFLKLCTQEVFFLKNKTEKDFLIS